ncbi:hypothetical protein BACCIP111883_03503 [Sutcliffiella rhizosphaerae]|uniref:Uncharacterized protein n=1 Tax=Sutcliffiella rhizosphaerae TaxID=2880967 RepID=A0ABM8YS81_9BACI|nr:hypothetical protein BACCIP111883_03503 [Sutcliffiella rhizosphaerae]
MNNFKSICEQFAIILKGKGKIEQNSCSVSLHRNFKVLVQGRLSASVSQVEVLFESLDQHGNALCLSEIAILEEEIPSFRLLECCVL